MSNSAIFNQALNTPPLDEMDQNAVVHEARGTHLLLTLFGCPSDLLNDEPALRLLAEQSVKSTGATLLELTSHKFSPQGVTVLAVLAESHASMHTYPETGTVFWDCFTCGQSCKPDLSVAPLIKALQPSSIQQQLITRGVQAPETL